MYLKAKSKLIKDKIMTKLYKKVNIMNESLARRVKSFPPLDETVVKIQEISNRPNSSIRELTQVIEKDPMLTANILKATNSPLYGFSREIKNINQAVSLFGMGTVKGFALASAMQNGIKMDLSPYGLTKGQFLNASLSQNALMFSWYSKVNRSMLDILMPASFLLEIGRIILSEELKEQKKDKDFLDELSETKIAKEVSELEKKYLDITTEEMTAAILEHWNLESKMVNAIRYSLKLEEVDDGVEMYAVALNIVKNVIGREGKLNEFGIKEAYKIIEKYALDKAKFTKSLENFS